MINIQSLCPMFILPLHLINFNKCNRILKILIPIDASIIHKVPKEL